MKRLLFAVTVLSSVAHAEVIKCPEQYPTKEVVLSNDESGAARIRSARLSGAYFVSGELYATQQFVPDISKVKGGWDIGYGFGPNETRWKVCLYGGSQWGLGAIERWEKLEQKFTNCEMKVREIKIPGTTSDWTATAVCK